MTEAASQQREPSSASKGAGAEISDRKVWDPLVRLTHWGIAVAVLFNGLLVEGGSLVHVWLGYAAFGLLALRLLWGFIGTQEARFSAFPPSLSGAVRHLADLLSGKRPRHRSHNPLGALMVYTLWAMLTVVSVTGVMLEGAPFPAEGAIHEAQLAHDEDEGEEGFLHEAVEELHEAAANFLLLLAALHVGGVLLESRLTGVNVTRAMIGGAGEKRSEHDGLVGG